jgi:hypothetical protein
MHLPINVKSPNNISKCHMGINSTFKGLIVLHKWTASKFNVLNSSPFETLHATFQSTPSPVSYLQLLLEMSVSPTNV